MRSRRRPEGEDLRTVRGRVPGLPLHKLPDLRLQLAFLTDLGEDGHSLREVAHGLLGAARGVEQVGQVVVQRRLAMTISYGDAHGERGPAPPERPTRVPAVSVGEGQVVEGRYPGR